MINLETYPSVVCSNLPELPELTSMCIVGRLE